LSAAPAPGRLRGAPAGQPADEPQSQTAVSRSDQGYPSLMSKKKRVCVATYQHSGGVWFENSVWPRPNMTNL
jgi:hypothetical protein